MLLLCLLLAAAPATPIDIGGVVGTILVFEMIDLFPEISVHLPAIPMRADNLRDTG